MKPPSSPSRLRLLIVDDHIVMRMGLVSAANTEPDLEVVAEAGNGLEAIEAFRLHQPDLVVLDLRMPKSDGFEVIRHLREESPQAHILVFSNYASGEEVYRALKSGATGFVVKDMSLERLLEAIRVVGQGQHYIPPEVSTRLSVRVASNLSQRESEVLQQLAKGMSNKEVGAALGLAENTIKVHLANIFTKLHVSDRTQAVLAAIKQEIIHLE
jgi:DNA-binding NarL/FixJ family response regulator